MPRKRLKYLYRIVKEDAESRKNSIDKLIHHKYDDNELWKDRDLCVYSFQSITDSKPASSNKLNHVINTRNVDTIFHKR